MRRMLDRSRLLAGKTDPENSNLWLPLWMHLRDTAEIMELLVRKWLPDSVKRASGLEEEELVQLARFLGWEHDLGKAILTFQSTIMQCLPEAKQRLERLTPLSCRELNRRETPHARASEAILRKLGCPGGIASVAGAHHGKPQDGTEVDEQFTCWEVNYYPEEQKGIWEGFWNELLQAALQDSSYSGVDALPVLNQPEEILLTGLLVMADWIASNTDYFPLIPVEETGSEAVYRNVRIGRGANGINRRLLHPGRRRPPLQSRRSLQSGLALRPMRCSRRPWKPPTPWMHRAF